MLSRHIIVKSGNLHRFISEVLERSVLKRAFTFRGGVYYLTFKLLRTSPTLEYSLMETEGIFRKISGNLLLCLDSGYFNVANVS